MLHNSWLILAFPKPNFRHEEETSGRARSHSIPNLIPDWWKHHPCSQIFHGHLQGTSLGNVRVFLSEPSAHTRSFRFFRMESMVGRLDEYSAVSYRTRSFRLVTWPFTGQLLVLQSNDPGWRTGSGCGFEHTPGIRESLIILLLSPLKSSLLTNCNRSFICSTQ